VRNVDDVLRGEWGTGFMAQGCAMRRDPRGRKEVDDDGIDE